MKGGFLIPLLPHEALRSAIPFNWVNTPKPAAGRFRFRAAGDPAALILRMVGRPPKVQLVLLVGPG